MALISLQEINLAFSGPLIFDSLDLQLEPRERIALLGRNGVGKTTLMRVMAGQQQVDSGRVIVQKGIQVADFLRLRLLSNLTFIYYYANFNRKQVNRLWILTMMH